MFNNLVGKKIVFNWVFDFVDWFNNEIYEKSLFNEYIWKCNISLFLDSLKYWFKKVILVIIFDEFFFI